MKKSISKLYLLLAAIIVGAMSVGFASCNSSDDPDNPATIFNIVTVKSNNTLSGSIFTFRVGETTPLITLTSTQAFNESYGVNPGDRIMIGYTLPAGQAADQSGPIDLISFMKVYNDTVCTATPEILNTWAAAGIYNTDIWRTGNYLNAYCVGPYNTSTPTHLCLYADTASIANGQVTMYLTLNDRNAAPTQQVDMYSSINLQKFFAKYPDVHTITVNVANPYNKPQVTFNDVYPLPD